MKRISILIIIALASASVLRATGELTPTGSRMGGMGHCSVALTDFWGIMNNQAGMALINQFSAAVSYESRFMQKELSTKTAGFLAPTKFGVLGLSYRHSGFQLYNEQKIGLSYARSFGPYLRIGLQLNYLQAALGEGYGKKGSATCELGIQSDVTEKITLGVWTFNPLRAKLADYDDERIQSILRVGLAWHLSKQFIVTAEAEKNTYYRPVIVRAGAEYNIKERFFIRTGTSTYGEIFTMGFGFTSRHFTFDISAGMHETLGFSPQSSLLFQF